MSHNHSKKKFKTYKVRLNFVNTKSQAAMEFLMTYGWALLIVLIVIGALAYFGVLNPTAWLPDKVELVKKLDITDVSVDENSISFIVQNRLGKNIYDFQVNATVCNNMNGTNSTSVQIPEGKTKKITVYCDHDMEVGYKLDTSLVATWSTKTSSKGESFEFDHGTLGLLQSTVNQGKLLYDRVDLTACGTLDLTKTRYILQSNLSYDGTCLNVGTNDIEIDFNGFKITGGAASTDQEYGINIVNANNTNIIDGDLTNFTIGVYAVNSTLLNVSGGNYSENGPDNDLVNANNGYGIYLLNSPNYTIENMLLHNISHSKMPGPSCPFVFAWNSSEFVFRKDPSGWGFIGLGFPPLYSQDLTYLGDSYVIRDGKIPVRLLTDPFEVDFIDEVALLAVDYPEDVEVRGPNPAFNPDLHIFTIKNPKPIVSAELKGVYLGIKPSDEMLEEIESAESKETEFMHIDVFDKVNNADYEFTVVKDNNFIELDLGDISGAEQIKLIMKGYGDFSPATPDYRGPPSLIKVMDNDGNWIPGTPLGLQIGFGAYPEVAEYNTVIFDITDSFNETFKQYKVRLYYDMPVYIDYLTVDTSKDREVIRHDMIMPEIAELRYKGVAKRDQLGEYGLPKYQGEPAKVIQKFTGNATRYGDVLPIVNSTDDMYAVMVKGDEIALEFDISSLPELQDGMKRAYFLYDVAFYKPEQYEDFNIGPLPFMNMTVYPYNESVENYPDDDEHNNYIQEYNTRFIEGVGSSGKTHNTRYGIYAYGSNYGTIRNITGNFSYDSFYSNYGIYLYRSNYTSIWDVTFQNASYVYYSYYSLYNNLTNIRSDENYGTSFYLYYSNYTNATGITLNNVPYDYRMYLYQSYYSNLTDLYFGPGYYAFYIYLGTNNNISNVTMDSVSYQAIYLRSSNNIFKDVKIMNVNQSTSSKGIYIYESSDNIFDGGYINGSIGYGIYLYSNAGPVASNTLFKDMWIENCSIAQVYGYTNDATGKLENTTFVNVSFDRSNVTLTNNGDGGAIELKSYWNYKAYVNDSSGNPVSGAYVTVYDKTSTLKLNMTTNSSGWTPTGEILDSLKTVSTMTYYSDFTINATNGSLSGARIGGVLNITAQEDKLDDVITIS